MMNYVFFQTKSLKFLEVYSLILLVTKILIYLPDCFLTLDLYILKNIKHL